MCELVGVAGRVVFARNSGKLCFATLQEGDGTQLQAMLSLDKVGQESLDAWKAVLAAAVVNQGNMGLPMATLAFGDAGLQRALGEDLIRTPTFPSLVPVLGAPPRVKQGGQK